MDFYNLLMAATAISTPLSPAPQVPDNPAAILGRMLANTSNNYEVVHVTNLNATGTGSFSEAVTEAGGGNAAGTGGSVTRIVVFDVSGEIDMIGASIPKGKGNGQGGDYVQTYRKNLYIAGSTAPSPGVIIRGQILFRDGPFYMDHLRFRPVRGGAVGDDGQSDMRAILYSPHFANGGASGPREWGILRNVETEFTMDVAGGFLAETDGTENATPANCVIDNCMFAQPLHWGLSPAGQSAGVDWYNGSNTWNNPNVGSQPQNEAGHNFGFSLNYGTHNTLYRGNLTTCSQYRNPLLAELTTVHILNNYLFGYGHHGGSATLWKYPLVFLDRSSNRGVPITEFPGENRIGYIGNVCEAGRTTSQNSNRALVNPDHELRGFNVRLRNLDNRFINFFSATPTGDALSSDAYLTALAALETTAQEDYWFETPTFSDNDWLDWPNYETDLPLPKTVLTPGTPGTSILDCPVRTHVLTYAGARPNERDEVSQAIINGIGDRTLVPVGSSTELTTPLAANTNAWQEPASPLASSSKYPGLTVLEEALVDAHLAAGGCPTTVWDAGEWVDRA